ncbi:MAG: VIT domain-containing protein [Kofleriaceae bacterium]|nr:VIT domain-containing protein [Kofleriaceae bacterium]
MSNESKDVLERNVETLLETGGEPPRISDAARARIRNHLLARASEAPVPRRSPMFAIGVGLAATAAAALIVTRVVGGDAPKIAVTQGGAVQKLADGSTWTAAPGGKVTVLGERRVRVEGMALLDVAPGKGTFVVETARGTIEVLGTRFVVEAAAEKTTASVVRGQVKLASESGDVLLHAGEQGVAEPGRPPTRGPAPRLSHLTSWAAQARRQEEKDVTPLHHGTLFARDPGVRSHPPWGDEYPLPIKKLGVDIVIENQVARVALDQTFHNNRPETLEGVYRFAIPPDAALQRLAMYVDGKLTESAVVERMRARRIYEELVYRRVDPALLEWAGTGRLSLRVYPLLGNQDKRLMLAYTQSLPRLYGDWSINVPLPEIDQPVGEVAFDVTVKGCANCEITSTSHRITVERKGEDAQVSYRNTKETIGDSLVLHVRDPRGQPTVAKHTANGDAYLMVRAPAELPRTAQTYRPRTWVILDDVSASRGALERRAQADMIDAFVRELDEEDRLAVIAFDVTARTKLAPTRVLDVDRTALRASLKDEGNVGATDFAVALDAATGVLAGVAPEDAMLVYLGDGVITSGARNLDALRTRLAGKVTFVGVGVGDGPDTQTLQALAAATGGYATTIDLADDVGWKTFDLVAALHTQRVTGVEARLVDASGAPVPSTLYVRSPQLADGEEIELVARLAGGGTPAAVELSGTTRGAPWRRTIQLASSAAVDGGYLPRLWAQRHIAARMLAKHEAVIAPPCAPGVGRCSTEAELRQQRDEQIRREVVQLGKRYFLLSRHTSLLVLENDAMYAKYDVTKGAGDTWAPYALPATIPVVTTTSTPVVTDVADDAELVRTPVQVFYGDGYFDDGFVDARQQALETARLVGVLGGETLSTDIGSGEIGHGAGGGGIGSGYGVGPTRTRSNLGLRDEVAAPQPPAVTTSPSAESADGEPPSPPVGADAPVLPADPAIGKKGDFDRAETKSRHRDRVASDEISGGLLAGNLQFETDGNGRGRAGLRSRRPMLEQRFSDPADQAFDDVTSWVPALFTDAADAWRVRLGARNENAYPMDDAARTLLAQARAALPSGVYRWNDVELAVDAARRIGWRRTTDADLAETASYDGAMWTRRYAELGLDVTRAVSTDDIAIALAYLPVWIAEPAHYARYFEVRAKDARTITLARPVAGTSAVMFELAFDDRARLVALRDASGGELLSVMWGDRGPTAARIAGRTIDVGFAGQAVADAMSWAHGPGSTPSVVVELPGRMPAYWQTRVAKERVGSAAWRHAQRQLMVSLAAVNNRVALYSAYEALKSNGGVELGDLALASGGIASGATEAQFAPALAPFTAPGSPGLALARYLIAGRAYGTASRPESLRAEMTSGLVGALWQLREATAYAVADKGSVAVDRIVAMGNRALQLRLIGVAMVSQRTTLTPAELVRLWDAVAIGRYRNVARAQAAIALLDRGHVDEAFDRVASMIADLDLHALPPVLDQVTYRLPSSRRGNAGWLMLWAQWRDKALASTSFEHVMALVSAVAQQRDDLPAILTRAAELAGGNANRRTAVMRRALSMGMTAWAQTAIEPMLRKYPSRELHLLAAQIALSQARSVEALGHLEAAQRLAGDDAVGISTVRAELGAILAVAKQAAKVTYGADRDAIVVRAAVWANKWRAIDEGNPDIDRTLGEIYLAVGNKEEAWRQLSTVIERDPMVGAGYMTVAEAFERQGRVEDALPFWQQAIVIEQTNPTPRLRKAQALIALGRHEEGDALLREVANGKWHDIWSSVQYQAKYLLQQRRSSSPR